MWLQLLLLSFILAQAFSFKLPYRVRTGIISSVAARRRSSDGAPASPTSTGPDYEVGVDVPEEVLRQAAIYDMILVERFNAPITTTGGLFLPKVEGKDEKHTAMVISMGTSYGLESEQGRLQSMEEIAPYKKGDIVFVRDPWGIGPKDLPYGERCFSFHKAAQITGVIRQSADA